MQKESKEEINNLKSELDLIKVKINQQKFSTQQDIENGIELMAQTQSLIERILQLSYDVIGRSPEEEEETQYDCERCEDSGEVQKPFDDGSGGVDWEDLPCPECG